MKIAKLFLSLFLLVSVLMPIKAFSLDITAGVSTWYANQYQPYTKDIYHKTPANSGRYDSTKNKPNLLYGPALSVRFSEDFNLTFVFLYGKFKLTEVDEHEIGFPGHPDYYDINYSLKRMDSDIVLNYRIIDYFKIFAGVKYLSFSTKHNFDSSPFAPTMLYELRGMVYELDRSGIGPGLGFSIILPIPLFDNLFLISNISVFYLWVEEKKGYFDSGAGDELFVKTKCKDYGMNLTMSFAYYIAPISTTISVGGRGQFVRTKYDSEYGQHLHRQGAGENTSGFYGVTLTATYSFSLN